jgi:hypothetical protein
VGGSGKGAAVQQNRAFRIAPNEIAPTEEIESPRPAMGVERHGVAPRDACVQDADGFIFEEQGVMLGGGDQGIEVRGKVGRIEHARIIKEAVDGPSSPDGKERSRRDRLQLTPKPQPSRRAAA